MRESHATNLDALAASLRDTRPSGFVDLYVERVADAVWELAGGAAAGRHALLREGAAVRREGTLHSSDGATRVILADLLGVPGRRLPPLELPRFPEAPDLNEVPREVLLCAKTVRWRWRWAAVLTAGGATELFRPELCEVTMHDGLRVLATWPPSLDAVPPPLASRAASAPAPGPVRVLLSPQAAAVLLHEAVGHPLEGDALPAGGELPRGGRQHRRLDIALDIADDPTQASLPGGFSADDEGVAARRRPLVRDGEIVGVLADRSSAARLGVPPGNARRASVHAFPRPRISNLVAESREPVEEPPRGEAEIEIGGFSSGSFVPGAGEIRLVSRVAWRLRGGRRSRPLGPFLLVGKLDRSLTGIVAAGRPVASSEPGWCGKGGEVLPTGAVAPWILVDGLEVR